MAVPALTGPVSGPPPEGMVRAQNLAHDTLRHVMGLDLVGLTDRDLASAAESYARDHGATDFWCPTLVGAGDASLVCHPMYSPVAEHRFADGDIVWLDTTPVLDGWYGDATQVWFVGEPDERDLRLRRDALAIEQAGLEYAEPGMPACELFSYVHGLITAAGYLLLDLWGNVGHDLGHGTAYEGGFIDATNRTPMWGAWTMEPHLGDRRRGAKFEDVVWLAEDGTTRL